MVEAIGREMRAMSDALADGERQSGAAVAQMLGFPAGDPGVRALVGRECVHAMGVAQVYAASFEREASFMFAGFSQGVALAMAVQRVRARGDADGG